MTAPARILRRWTRPGLCLSLFLLGLWLDDGRAQPVAIGQAAPLDGATNGTRAPSADPGVATDPVVRWRAELEELGTTNTAVAEAAISAWLDRLLAGKVAKELQLEVLEAAGKHKAPAITEKLARYQAARLEEGGLATSGELLYGGDVARGRKIFFEKPEAICIKCHKVGREGGETGPPLGVGATNLSREYILESLLFPNAKITPGFETVVVCLKDRSAYSGIVKHENDTELAMDCPPDGIVTLQKADIVARRKGSSLMPDGLEKTLSPRELRDLIEFVASLKQEGADRGAGIASAPDSRQDGIVRAVR